MRSTFILAALVSFTILTACTRSATQATGYNPPAAPAATGFITPVATSSHFYIPTPRPPGAPIATPTPDQPHYVFTQRSGPEQYTVQAGDTLGVIARRYSVDIPSLMQANNLADANRLEIGQVLIIPVPTPGAPGPDFKVIPDSELIYGPVSITLDVNEFVKSKAGYLYTYTQNVEGDYLNGAQIIERVAQNYSINPRLLLAILEHRSGWVTNPSPDPSTLDYPIGYYSLWHAGLYRQLTFTANALNQGFYGWLGRKYTTFLLVDGSIVPASPTINAGTAGVQLMYGLLLDRTIWENAVSADGVFKTYSALFGNPFDLTMEPLIIPGLTQPPMQLPFAEGETWSFTGGPHGGWDSGSPWAALDFAPPGEPQGCVMSDYWVTAIADGVIVRAANGAVIQDLDMDGYEQTGWVVLYMHIDTRNRVLPGTVLRAGERIGHPSCEGGISNGTHVHLARRFNGIWVPANGGLPFLLDGWVSSGTDREYDGFLHKGDQVVEAWDGRNDLNQIRR